MYDTWILLYGQKQDSEVDLYSTRPRFGRVSQQLPQSLTKPNEKTLKTRPKAMEKLNDQKFLDEAQARSGSLEERVCRTKQLN